MSGDDWLPEGLRPSLARYRSPQRIADPTDGFARRLAEFHPDYDERYWASLSPASRWTYVRGLLGIPERAGVMRATRGATVGQEVVR